MGTKTYIGLVGSRSIARRIRRVRRTATRVTVSISVAVLVVMAPVMPVASASSSDVPPPVDRTALILGGTTVPTPDKAYIDAVRNHFIAPTHPRQNIDYVAVTAPMEAWPVTGIGRVGWFAVGPPSIWGPGGPAWPAEPWWKLSGLFDLTFDRSVQTGVIDLEDAMAEHGNDHLVIYGYSQGAIVANVEKRKLAEQYPAGTKAPDIDFVLSADLNLPNGGLSSRFPGLYLPILDVTFNGPERTDTQFDTASINRQYDGFADFPLYPLNLVATVNALLGAVYLHPYELEPSLADPGTPLIHRKHGDTDYYFFETQDLPLFDPLRAQGVPEPLIDVVEPVFRVIVELGYDRSIPPWQPTPARLIPRLDPATVAADLVDAIGEGINNALSIAGLSPPARTDLTDVPLRTKGQLTEGLDTGPTEQPNQPAGQPSGTSDAPIGQAGRDVGAGISQVLTTVESRLPAAPTPHRETVAQRQRQVADPPAAARHQINDTIAAVRSVIGDGRNTVVAAGRAGGAGATLSTPSHKTPVRDAVHKVPNDVKKVVTTISERVTHALNGIQADHDNRAAGAGGDAK